MHLFYTPDVVEAQTYCLNKEEASHCVKVLRMKEGDVILLTNGRGNIYEAEIIQATVQSCLCNIINEVPVLDKRDYSIRIAVAPTKNNARIEWFTEKATEIGIDEISLFKSRYSERTNIKTERLEKVVISAVKQSIKAFIPTVSPLTELKQIIDTATEKHKFIATCSGDDRVSLKQAYTPNEDVVILIGPEGDFSEQEVTYALTKGFKPPSLGTARLRTETAALYALQGIHYINSK
ncbi:MAG: 16S rRNA (uracil(1498)-N(3))-methyltransferase [Bacteroidales bacterium]|nr:16S rRNA (uracil(1498)-N(3))-methyltransferase [Bacteroidales bacterium]